MSNRRTLMAAAAIVLAAVAGIGVYMYASNADKRAQQDARFVEALVATSDIAKGTTAARGRDSRGRNIAIRRSRGYPASSPRCG